ncbi:MAG: adenosylmethionine--8-amino-7-oxononanoate transaminase [Candidatus Delongbacteria bacterium]|nr:adenosylmethionine--8-amino-7-oxononanoate transaminase [Candidatus Delongbacteria bacterium]MCG2760612.1 adenosylmethionine--8-amino-7-oxononanoate transaminase [Candidatus Delongbacteria bacterium]
MNDLLFDKEHIWHPYSSFINPDPAYKVISCDKVRLKLEDGAELIDGMSSWWAAIHGYNVPELNKSVIDQSAKMSHVMFGGLTHDPAISLCRKIIEITPEGLDKVFLCDSGSVAVEVTMKMALQYWFSKGIKDKNKFLTIRSGYHGDTFNAMSVCDPDTGMHQMYKGVLPENYFADSPECGYYDEWDCNKIKSFKDIIEKENHKIAAVILEPIVQGAGGMKFYHPKYLNEVRKLCDRFGILLIFDEIATGFGRTGELWGCDHSKVTPDIMCIGKALTGGYMTLAATIASGKVALGISEGKAPIFMHGPTFMANPLACSVANKSIDLLLNSNWRSKVKNIEEQLKNELLPIREMFSDKVKDVRVLGAIGVVELRKKVDVAKAQKYLTGMGIWLRPFGNLLYTMPPYIIGSADLSRITEGMYKLIENDEY